MRAAQSVTLPAFQATVAAPPDHVRALEAALVSARPAEERFRGLIESTQAIPYIADWDEQGSMRYISPQVENVLGYPAECWHGGQDPWEPKLHAEDRERVLAASARTFAEERDFECEYRMHAADGRVACFPGDPPDADVLLHAADAAMYRVKGRSRPLEPGR